MFIRTRLVRFLTFGFASAITLFPVVLIGKGTRLNRRLVVHERIHLRQQAEMLVLPFYIWYLFEYLWKYLQYKNHYLAYRNLSFEREAYKNDRSASYLHQRPFWGWRYYL